MVQLFSKSSAGIMNEYEIQWQENYAVEKV